MCASNGIALLVVGRVICGLGIGMASSIVPVYQAEVAPKEIRGRVISCQQWAITWGILIQYFIQYGASEISPGASSPDQSTAAFRIPWGIQMVPGVIFLSGLLFFPHSPRWLASKDRWEEARAVLAKLHAEGNEDDPRILAEYTEIEQAIYEERANAHSMGKRLVEPQILKRVVLGMASQMWSQLCGMNVMMYYIVYIMQTVGSGSPLLTAAIQYILNVIMTLPALLFLDKMGRRPTMLIGYAGMAMWLFIVGGLEAGYGEAVSGEEVTWSITDKRAGKAIIACSYLFVCTYASTVGPVSWTYPAEIFPTSVRAVAVSLATATNWTWNALLGLFVPPLMTSINWKMYMLVRWNSFSNLNCSGRCFA